MVRSDTNPTANEAMLSIVTLNLALRVARTNAVWDSEAYTGAGSPRSASLYNIDCLSVTSLCLMDAAWLGYALTVVLVRLV